MSPWFLVSAPRAGVELRLFTVPHAGCGASHFMPWRALLPQPIELNAVQLPGRERRLAEAPLPVSRPSQNTWRPPCGHASIART